MRDRKRIMIVAHGHPDFSIGGAEIAATNLHRALRDSGEFDAWLVARHADPDRGHFATPFSGNRRPGEILFRSTIADSFLFSQDRNPRTVRHFRELLETVKPDLVHFHHFQNLGLELIGEVKKFGADIPVVLTLHEYLAICNNSGQMVKTAGDELCHRATPVDCARCFRGRTAQDFMLRERFIKTWFDQVDRFVAPSEFLAARFAEWGLERSRIEVIENLLAKDSGATRHPTDPPASQPGPATGSAATAAPLRFAYFGQINHFKGLDLLLDALLLLPKPVRERVRLDINGSGLEKQPFAIRRRILRAMKRLGETASLRGPYRAGEVGPLMETTDWMIMPSRWWENSPVVILEARRHGLPVICSDIGGMAEKIEHEVTGLHFRVGNAASLARTIERAVMLGAGREAFARRMHATADESGTLERQLALHHELLAAPGRLHSAAA